jgi:hypothetical protein
MSKTQFEAKLDKWCSTLGQFKTNTQEIANEAMTHFAMHGDLLYLQLMHDAIRTKGKNFVRLAAFNKWLMDHAPIKSENNKLTKSTTGAFTDEQKTSMEAALLVAFWEHSPETQQANWGADELVADFAKIIARRTKQADHAKDSVALQALKAAQGMVLGLTKTVEKAAQKAAESVEEPDEGEQPEVETEEPAAIAA